MLKSLFLRVFGGHLLVVLLLVTVLLFSLLGTVRTGHVENLTVQLERLATALADRLAGEEDSIGNGVEEELKRLGERLETRITLMTVDGRVLADSEADAETMEDHSVRPEFIEAVQGRPGSDVRLSRTVGSQMLYVAVPVHHNGEVAGVMRVSMHMREVEANLRQLGTELVITAAILLLLALGLTLLIARDVSKPVGRLVRAARRVGSGDFDLRVPAGRDDELGELSAGFNDMVTRLRDLVAREKDRKAMLDKVIGAMREGLVVFDREGKVTLANPAFAAIVGTRRLEGRFLWEVVREPALADLAHGQQTENGTGIAGAAVQSGAFDETATARAVIGGRSYLCSASRLSSSHETVITLHDITDIERIAEVKRDLVINASHELRTPLTAMKGFIETLTESVEGEPRRYVEVIARHTDRLISIVEDLLVLAQVEDKYQPELEPVDLGALTAGMMSMFEKRARDKGIELKLDIAPGLPPVAGDAFRLEQVIINLVDNAIKYTDEGRVLIRLIRDGESVRLEIEDTGIGIPAGQLPRIWERFFVTDKARSRRLGGTGLGLAIVKHIVSRHRGTVQAESRPGEGSRFTVILPVA